jgi:hypothetical protein
MGLGSPSHLRFLVQLLAGRRSNAIDPADSHFLALSKPYGYVQGEYMGE